MRVPVPVKVSVFALVVMGAYTYFANSIPQIQSKPPAELSLEAAPGEEGDQLRDHAERPQRADRRAAEALLHQVDREKGVVRAVRHLVDGQQREQPPHHPRDAPP